jgi:hypothetical protein
VAKTLVAEAGTAMSYIGVTADEAGLAAATPGAPLPERLAPLLAAAPPGAPIVVLVHGYRFDPAVPNRDPHRGLYATRPETACRRVRSWPLGLGFGRGDPSGLCIGLAWPAFRSHLPELVRHGRTGFARVYHRAGQYGRRLAELVGLVQRLAPGRAVDVLAHSLGARIALAALPHLAAAPGRMILLGAAEYDGRALEALAARRGPRPPEVYNVTSRANDLYDLMFERFAPRRSRHDRALGHGLPVRRPDWIDLQVDRPDVVAWAGARGIRLGVPAARLCHRSFYVRSGTLELYQAILRRRPGFDVADLREAPCFAGQEPRWSRVLPAIRLPGPLRHGRA